ncbi:DUF4292 domain-containing protein [Porphyromonadaceae bacterium OttesenSCG-928-L07]|nr:DUF4292 domain-containing protein [Porphyromonadaceae bacterium OttesenSCG-928-L07]
MSCRSAREVVVYKEIPNIPEGKLYKNIEDNACVFNSLYSKKLDLSINQNGKKNNLSGSLKIQRDTFIWISLTASLGIEVARLWITPDSVKFVDPYNKQYLLADYQYFSERLGINMSYECLQNILTNKFFNIETCLETDETKETKFKFEKSNECYVLSNVHKRSLDRKVKKLYKKKRKNKEFSLIFQKIDIHPELFRPSGILLRDMDEESELIVGYKNFKDYEGVLFPENFLFAFISEDEKYSIEIKFSRLEFNTPVVPNFRISPKYKEIK